MTIQLSDACRAELKALRESDKFSEDFLDFYPGASSEENRLRFEQYANEMITRILEFPDHFEKTELLQVFRTTLDKFADADTEDRERICVICEKVMTKLGVKSSDGLLNGWLYA